MRDYNILLPLAFTITAGEETTDAILYPILLFEDDNEDESNSNDNDDDDRRFSYVLLPLDFNANPSMYFNIILTLTDPH